MKKKAKANLSLGVVADICGIIALPIALGVGLWLVLVSAVFIAGLVARPYLDSRLSD